MVHLIIEAGVIEFDAVVVLRDIVRLGMKVGLEGWVSSRVRVRWVRYIIEVKNGLCGWFYGEVCCLGSMPSVCRIGSITGSSITWEGR